MENKLIDIRTVVSELMIPQRQDFIFVRINKKLDFSKTYRELRIDGKSYEFFFPTDPLKIESIAIKGVHNTIVGKSIAFYGED